MIIMYTFLLPYIQKDKINKKKMYLKEKDLSLDWDYQGFITFVLINLLRFFSYKIRVFNSYVA